MPDLKQKLINYQETVDTGLANTLQPKSLEPARLHEAMHYVVFNGGKRVRPVLVFASAEALGASAEDALTAAMAIELIHAYSLVHDDLPAMDDDDLRRGKPTCHIAYDEATAILVGDALLTYAFEIMATQKLPLASNETRLKMIQLLAEASGSVGMVGGQAIDLYSVGKALDLDSLKHMHLKKTGALIKTSALLGAYASGKAEEQHISALEQYSECIGLAFQIQDDILDVEGDTEIIGKSQGSDEAKNKPTYPALLGLDGAKKAAIEMHEKALTALSIFDEKANTLRDLSEYIIQRKN